MKSSVTTMVDGSPPINPPTLLPKRSAAMLLIVTHMPPTRKLSPNLIQKDVSMGISYALC